MGPGTAARAVARVITVTRFRWSQTSAAPGYPERVKTRDQGGYGGVGPRTTTGRGRSRVRGVARPVGVPGGPRVGDAGRRGLPGPGPAAVRRSR